MGIAFSDTLRTTRANAIITAINNGTGSGTMQFYTSPQPAKGVAITTQTWLGALTFSNPAGTVAAGILTAATIADDTSVAANGIVNWVRILDGNGAFVADMSATVTGGAGPVTMPSLQVYAGGILHDVSFVLTEGNA